jgi:DNA-directed RNA polymerase subunit M/transcription elongation factor TFIIS
MEELRKLARSQLKRVLGMTDRKAIPLEEMAWKNGKDNYARTIRLLLTGEKYEAVMAKLNINATVSEVIVENTDHLVVEGMTQCPKCRSRRVRTNEMQTRGCDESKTQFNQCVECKHQWKF